MATIESTLLLVQALGAVVGALCTIWGEFAYVRAIGDKRVDAAELAHLNAIARGLYFGMTLLLLASLGLVITAYLNEAQLQPALTSSYWSFMALALLTTLLTGARSRGHISFSVGTGAIFTAWWFLAYLALGQLPPLSFGASIALYLVATTIFYGLLRLVRHIMISRAHTPAGSV